MRSTRFAVRGLAVFAALTFALAACEENVVPPAEEITVSVLPQNPSIDVGETITLTAVVNGTDNKGVTWASQNSNIASVNASTGEVTGNQAGQAVITATSSADPDVVGATTVTVNPPPAIEVTIFPTDAGSRQVRVGQTLQLTAQVSNTTNQAVSWSSQTPNLATVDANTGVVTGVAAGTAIIQATPAADPSRAATTSVTVLPEVPVNVVIQSITKQGQAVDRDDISGQIEVTIEFEAPAGSNVSGLQVLVDDEIVCSQNIGGGEADLGDEAEALATVVCSIATQDFATDGTPSFLNGQHVIAARITTPGGSIRAESGDTVTFNNRDGWVIDLAASAGPALDDDGLSWYGGDVTVTGLPVEYSGNTINFANFFLLGKTKTDTADAAGFSVVFSSAVPTELQNFQGGDDVEDAVSVFNAVYSNGQPAPDIILEWRVDGAAVDEGDFEFFIDNVDPDPGDFDLTAATLAGNPLENLCCSNDWVGADYAFADGKANHSDGGVGIDTVRFFAGDPGDDDEDIYNDGSGQEVFTGSDLAETQTNTELTVVAAVFDRLGNVSLLRLSNDDIGVDHDGPDLGGPNGPDDQQVFRTVAMQVWSFDTRSDTLSGFDLTNAGIATLVQNFDPENGCVVGDQVDDECNEVVGDHTVTTPATSGYFTMNFRMRDQAGNTTAASERTILMDGVEPTTSGPPVFPGTLTGGASATFGMASVEDDVDLDAFDMGILFAGVGTGERLPMGPWESVGDGFGGTLLDEAEDVEFTAPTFIRHLELTDTDDEPDDAGGPATDIFFRGRDVAGNVTSTFVDFAFAGGTVPAGENASAYAPDLETFHVESAEATICDASDPGSTDGDCDTNEDSTELSAVVTGPSGSFTNPYSRVLFYRVDQNTNAIEFLGAVTAANQEDDGSDRTFTYRLTLSATGLGAQAAMPIFAVAVTSDGDALRANDITIDVDVD